ncbi:MAG: hypothetical protein GY854_35380 [Deltaproteobacteria bacterium]|nr:hypothetical protein [Deltaproteobacteria bacterium]
MFKTTFQELNEVNIMFWSRLFITLSLLAFISFPAKAKVAKEAMDGLKAANALVAELGRLLAELKTEKPQESSFKQSAQYKKALAAYQKKVQAAKKDLSNTQNAVDKSVKYVSAAQKELLALKTKLSKAELKDAEVMVKTLEGMKAKLLVAHRKNVLLFEKINGKVTADKKGTPAASNPLVSGGTPASSGLPPID